MRGRDEVVRGVGRGAAAQSRAPPPTGKQSGGAEVLRAAGGAAGGSRNGRRRGGRGACQGVQSVICRPVEKRIGQGAGWFTAAAWNQAETPSSAGSFGSEPASETA